MSDEVLIFCPHCGDKQGPGSHPHCYINQNKGVYHCHFCGESGTVKGLAKEFPDIHEIIDLLHLSVRSFPTDYPTLRATLPVLLSDLEWATSYLVSRGLTTGEMVRFRACTSLTLPFRVIFPEYVGTNIAFWSARTVKKDHPKWLFAQNGTTPKKKSECVWGIDHLSKGSEIWIAEGIFDAIAVKGVCVYGKVPSNIQLQLILSKEPSKIIIAFDKDAPDETEGLKRRLKGIVKVDIQVPRAKDYGAYLQAGYRRIEGTEKFEKLK
jgi:hypothetical protein